MTKRIQTADMRFLKAVYQYRLFRQKYNVDTRKEQKIDTDTCISL
jgi:hypothetical protein